MGGEHGWQVVGAMVDAGSPPHGRGTRGPDLRLVDSPGLTPRMGGEHDSTEPSTLT